MRDNHPRPLVVWVESIRGNSASITIRRSERTRQLGATARNSLPLFKAALIFEYSLATVKTFGTFRVCSRRTWLKPASAGSNRLIRMIGVFCAFSATIDSRTSKRLRTEAIFCSPIKTTLSTAWIVSKKVSS